MFGGENGEQGKMNDVFIIDLSTMVFKRHVGTMQIKIENVSFYFGMSFIKLYRHTPSVGGV